MQTVSDTFLSTIRTSNVRKTVADIYYGSDTLPLIADARIIDGSLTASRDSDVRRSGSLILQINQDQFSDVDPYGVYLNIKSGFVFPSGNEELVSLGWFAIEDTSFNDGTNELTLNFFDRAKLLQDIQGFVDTDRSAQTCSDLINQAFSYTFGHLGYTPTITFDPSFNSNRKMPGGSVVTGTGLDTCNMVAQALAGEFFFDLDGNGQVGVIPSIDSTTTDADAVWEVDVGSSGVLIAANRSTTRANTYNGIAMYGASTQSGDRVHAIAIDNTASSKTYYWGRFGHKTKRMENDGLTTNAQCLTAATAELQNCLGLSKSVSFTSLWNPALDLGDITLFTFMDSSTELHLIDSLNFSFKSGEMSGTTRTVQEVV